MRRCPGWGTIGRPVLAVGMMALALHNGVGAAADAGGDPRRDLPCQLALTGADLRNGVYFGQSTTVEYLLALNVEADGPLLLIRDLKSADGPSVAPAISILSPTRLASTCTQIEVDFVERRLRNGRLDPDALGSRHVVLHGALRLRPEEGEFVVPDLIATILSDGERGPTADGVVLSATFRYELAALGHPRCAGDVEAMSAAACRALLGADHATYPVCVAGMSGQSDVHVRQALELLREHPERRSLMAPPAECAQR